MGQSAIPIEGCSLSKYNVMESYCNRSTVEAARQLCQVDGCLLQLPLDLSKDGFSLIVVIVRYSFAFFALPVAAAA